MAAVSQTVADAVVMLIGSLPLNPAPGAVVKGKKPTREDGDPATVIVVSQGEPEEQEPLYAVAGGVRWLVTYPVVVAFLAASGGDPAENETLRAWKQAVTAAMSDGAGLSGLGAACNDATPVGGAQFDAGGQKAMADVLTQRFRVEVFEVR